ncbi:hypothetical protein MUO65_02555, partial [bacterium]|nr:hypothetical protein [bacterium]
VEGHEDREIELWQNALNKELKSKVSSLAEVRAWMRENLKSAIDLTEKLHNTANKEYNIDKLAKERGVAPYRWGIAELLEAMVSKARALPENIFRKPAEGNRKRELDRMRKALNERFGKWSDEAAKKGAREIREEMVNMIGMVCDFRIFGGGYDGEKDNAWIMDDFLTNSESFKSFKTWIEKAVEMIGQDEFENLPIRIYSPIFDGMGSIGGSIITEELSRLGKSWLTKFESLREEYYQLTRWDFLNRFPGAQGMVLWRTTDEDKDRYQRTYLGLDKNKTFEFKDNFFTYIPSRHIQLEGYNEASTEYPVLVAYVPVESIRMTSWIETPGESEGIEPKVVVSGPAEYMDSMFIYNDDDVTRLEDLRAKYESALFEIEGLITTKDELSFYEKDETPSVAAKVDKDRELPLSDADRKIQRMTDKIVKDVLNSQIRFNDLEPKDVVVYIQKFREFLSDRNLSITDGLYQYDKIEELLDSRKVVYSQAREIKWVCFADKTQPDAYFFLMLRNDKAIGHGRFMRHPGVEGMTDFMYYIEPKERKMMADILLRLILFNIYNRLNKQVKTFCIAATIRYKWVDGEEGRYKDIIESGTLGFFILHGFQPIPVGKKARSEVAEALSFIKNSSIRKLIPVEQLHDYYRTLSKYDLFLSLKTRRPAETLAQPHDHKGRFAPKPGKSPKDAKKVIALSEYLQEVLRHQGWFSLDQYCLAYKLEADKLGFDPLAENWKPTARRDLEGLSPDFLTIDESGNVRLTSDGHREIIAIQGLVNLAESIARAKVSFDAADGDSRHAYQLALERDLQPPFDNLLNGINNIGILQIALEILEGKRRGTQEPMSNYLKDGIERIRQRIQQLRAEASTSTGKDGRGRGHTFRSFVPVILSVILGLASTGWTKEIVKNVGAKAPGVLAQLGKETTPEAIYAILVSVGIGILVGMGLSLILEIYARRDRAEGKSGAKWAILGILIGGGVLVALGQVTLMAFAGLLSGYILTSLIMYFRQRYQIKEERVLELIKKEFSPQELKHLIVEIEKPSVVKGPVASQLLDRLKEILDELGVRNRLPEKFQKKKQIGGLLMLKQALGARKISENQRSQNRVTSTRILSLLFGGLGISLVMSKDLFASVGEIMRSAQQVGFGLGLWGILAFTVTKIGAWAIYRQVGLRRSDLTGVERVRL